MQAINLISSQQFFRRVLVALCVILTLGLSGMAVGRAAAPAGEVVSGVSVELPAAIEANPVNGRELLRDQPAAEARPVQARPVEARPVEVTLRPAAAAAAVQPRTLAMEVTAYCPCTKCCGPKAQGITASGKLVDHNGGRFVAADTRVLPFGKKLSIPGYADNAPVEVIDRGGAIKGHKLDLYFPTHEQALIWGRQTLDVTVYE